MKKVRKTEPADLVLTNVELSQKVKINQVMNEKTGEYEDTPVYLQNIRAYGENATKIQKLATAKTLLQTVFPIFESGTDNMIGCAINTKRGIPTLFYDGKPLEKFNGIVNAAFKVFEIEYLRPNEKTGEPETAKGNILKPLIINPLMEIEYTLDDDSLNQLQTELLPEVAQQLITG